MVHYSTDYVFDGTKSEPYTEDDETRPLNVYGESKLNGEREVLQSGAHCVIFRVPWLYSCRGRNFVLTMLRLACANDSLTVVDDQIGTPTPATLIADLTAKVIISRRLAGLFHLAPEGSVSRYNLARAVIQAASIPAVTVRPVSSSQFPSAVRRPAYSVLSVKKFSAASGISLLPWQEYLKRSVSEFCAAGVVQ
jgi:dTDP-4-dehydrorhamnose reductase